MVPSMSLLPAPVSVTVTPEVTVCAGPAFAAGGLLAVPPPLELPPRSPPPPQPANRSARPETARPSLKWRMAFLYPPWLDRIVRIVTYGSESCRGFRQYGVPGQTPVCYQRPHANLVCLSRKHLSLAHGR